MAQNWTEQDAFQNMASADDMIRANGEAEEQEAQTLRDAAREYAREIQELKTLYEKNNEMIEKLQQMNIETAKGVQDAIEKSSGSDAIGESLADSVGKSHDDLLDSIQKTQEKIADLIQQSDQYAHKENVRVYRNIQAATDQLLQDQTKTLSNQLDTVKEAVNRPRKIPFAGATFALVLLLFLYEIADSLGLIQMVIRLVTGG